MATDVTRLEISQLVVDYGGGPILHEVDLTVEQGNVIGIFGANGSGRSSLLMGTLGYAPVTAGRVVLNGEDLTKRPPQWRSRAGLFLIPEDRGLFPPMTINDHFRLALRAKPTKSQLDEVGDVFPRIIGKRRQQAGSLSGGEAQMLSIALGLLAKPKVMLIDELSLGLAPNIVSQLLGICRQLADERGIGIVLVEQFVSLALEVVDEVAVMSSGSIVFAGSPDAVAADPEILKNAYLGGAAAGAL